MKPEEPRVCAAPRCPYTAKGYRQNKQGDEIWLCGIHLRSWDKKNLYISFERST